MKNILLLLLAACFLLGGFALADVSHREVTPVKHKVQKHKPHKAVKHKAPKHRHNSV